MADYDLDPGFEHRLERVLRTFADEGVDRFDAMETTQFAIRGAPRRTRMVPRPASPWLRPLLLAGLLAAALIAVGVVGGLIRLPVDDSPVNPSFEPFSPPPLPTLDASLVPSTGAPPTLAPSGPAATAGPGHTEQPSTPPPVETLSPPPSVVPTGVPTSVPTVEPTAVASDLPSFEPTIEPTVEPTVEPTPEVTPAPPGAVRDLGVGNLHTCALRDDGRVFCFGPNEMGELGDGSNLARYSADIPVFGLADAEQVAGGIRFTCALRATGNVVCWGWANRLGNGSPTNSSEPIATPVEVSGIDDAVEIAAGWNHTCARRAGGTISCWGLNGDGATGYGQLGDGTFDHAATPVEVAGVSDATAVAAGGWTTCALRSSGSAWCWGYGERGGLGDGNSVSSPTPVQVVGIDGARDITVGGWHACALLAGGHARCWGANSHGGVVNLLGDGTGIDRATPVDVVGVPPLRIIDAAWIHTVGVTREDRLWLWGAGAGEGGRPGEIMVTGEVFGPDEE